MNKLILRDWNAVKVVASLLVVIGHAAFFYTPMGAIRPAIPSEGLEFIARYLYSFHMPLFVMVSGAVYYHCKRGLHKYTRPGKFISNKFERLLVPYLFFAVIVVTPLVVYMGLNAPGTTAWQYLWKELLLGYSPRYLWYLLALFNIFVLFNCLEKYIARTNPFLLFLVLAAISIVAPALPGLFQVNNTLRFMFYFYVGYLVRKHKIYGGGNTGKCGHNLQLPGLLLLNVLCVWPVMRGFDHVPHAFLVSQTVGLIAALSGCALWYELCRRIAGSRLSETRFFRMISADSYGLYLLHPMILYLIFFYTRNLPIDPWLLAGASTVVSTVLSLLGVRLFRILHLQRFIGERSPKRI